VLKNLASPHDCCRARSNLAGGLMARPIARGRGTGWKRGESHHRSRLSDDDVRLMRELREEGLTYREIAEKFECSIWTARDIADYRTRA
jgi:hypothetical protein